jgi:hypothetical protein
MDSLVAAGAGFLLAVLWFDLMFDVQVLPHRSGDVPEPVLASIAGYYRRVTTEAHPMNRFVALAMLVTMVAIAAQAIGDDAPRWVSALSGVAAVVPIALAGSRTVPHAKRLGSRRDPLPRQATLARSVLHEHLFCIASIAVLLSVQLGWA